MPRILLVDDDHQRLLDREDLSGEGYEVIEAHDGHEAPQRLDEVSPDAMVLDIDLPGMDGLHTLTRIHERTSLSWQCWQHGGTLASSFEAHTDLLRPQPPFDLFETDGPLRQRADQHPPTLIRSAGPLEARAASSPISPGGVIVGATVHHSILSPHVSIDAGTLVEESIPMPGVRSGAGARIPRAIVNERVVVPADMVLGHDTDADARRFTVTPNGVTVVAEGTVVG